MYTGKHRVNEIVMHRGHECVVTAVWQDDEGKNGITIKPTGDYGFETDIYDDQLNDHEKLTKTDSIVYIIDGNHRMVDRVVLKGMSTGIEYVRYKDKLWTLNVLSDKYEVIRWGNF